MKIANLYDQLDGLKIMEKRHKKLWKELQAAIAQIDANQYTKSSKEKNRNRLTLYNQRAINEAFRDILKDKGWKVSKKTYYYVTGDIATAREIASLRNKEEQKKRIKSTGLTAYATSNEVDFIKGRVAVEVQFGKYFSVAYDIFVKHTFSYLRGDIDVGIEIIPTKAMSEKMDSGVPWFENEAANMIRIDEILRKKRKEEIKKKIKKFKSEVKKLEKKPKKNKKKIELRKEKIKKLKNEIKKFTTKYPPAPIIMIGIEPDEIQI